VWALLLKSNSGVMSLNCARISLCLAMSVAKMHRITPSRTWRNISGDRVRNMLQSLSSSTRNATEQWWFSRGEMSLYRRANSVLALICQQTCQVESW
jgi:hypothetical protein